MYEVSSEIYSETDFQPVESENGRTVSKFKFNYPTEQSASTDKDGDLLVPRKREGVIYIEHSSSTILKLVGLQVWRGALLLADFLFHNRVLFANKQILELGAGVGLTSIAAGIYSKNVVCTDVDIGGILDVIQGNIKRNQNLLKNNIEVMELDFKKPEFSNQLKNILNHIDIVIAADVIYDDDLTDGLIDVIDKLLDKCYTKKKTIFIALEKRYVFTIADLDTTAPCFDYFLKKASTKSWSIKTIPIDFPQYFQYERCKELVLLEVN